MSNLKMAMPTVTIVLISMSILKNCLRHVHKITRGSQRVVFKTDHYEGTLYKRSPYFIGTKLWNDLGVHDISLPDIFSFKKCLRRKNMRYVDLLA